MELTLDRGKKPVPFEHNIGIPVWVSTFFCNLL